MASNTILGSRNIGGCKRNHGARDWELGERGGIKRGGAEDKPLKKSGGAQEIDRFLLSWEPRAHRTIP